MDTHAPSLVDFGLMTPDYHAETSRLLFTRYADLLNILHYRLQTTPGLICPTEAHHKIAAHVSGDFKGYALNLFQFGESTDFTRFPFRILDIDQEGEISNRCFFGLLDGHVRVVKRVDVAIFHDG